MCGWRNDEDAAPQHWDERVRLAEEAAGKPRKGVSEQTQGQSLWCWGLHGTGEMFDFVINLRWADAIGLAVPDAVLRRATQVIA